MTRAAPNETSRSPAERLPRLLAEHGSSLERLAASYARSHADREDLLQEFASALWRALPAFRGECSERTFVLRVAHNRALTFLTKRGKPAEDVSELANDLVATSGSNPTMRYEKGEASSRLFAATRALPLGHRQVITLLLEGLSHGEIADVLGTSTNLVAVRANRARAAMRVLLEGDDR